MLIFIFAVVHSGLASLRDSGEKLIGERAFRVIFAGISLPLAVSTIVSPWSWWLWLVFGSTVSAALSQTFSSFYVSCFFVFFCFLCSFVNSEALYSRFISSIIDMMVLSCGNFRMFLESTSLCGSHPSFPSSFSTHPPSICWKLPPLISQNCISGRQESWESLDTLRYFPPRITPVLNFQLESFSFVPTFRC